MDNLESKAAIFALGGMSIGNAIVLLDASEGGRKNDTATNETGGKEKILFINSIKHICDIIFVVIVLFMISPLLIIVFIKVFATFIYSILFSQEQPGLRGCWFFRFKIRGMVHISKEIVVKSLNPNENNKPALKINPDHGISEPDRILLKTSINTGQSECWQLEKSLATPIQKGAWQILPDGNEVNFENWTQMEIQYIDNRSRRSDSLLFYKSFRTILLTNNY
jgi:lipopolysaccharide/colanic/teichoic acid biosynthesis glycosyltransferase